MIRCKLKLLYCQASAVSNTAVLHFVKKRLGKRCTAEARQYCTSAMGKLKRRKFTKRTGGCPGRGGCLGTAVQSTVSLSGSAYCPLVSAALLGCCATAELAAAAAGRRRAVAAVLVTCCAQCRRRSARVPAECTALQ